MGVAVQLLSYIASLGYGFKLAQQQQIQNLSLLALKGAEHVFSGFSCVISYELYTRVHANLPPEACEGWTIHFTERNSRYWVSALAGKKEASLFERGVKRAWDWTKSAQFIRWFTDGERRYGKVLWKLASVYLTIG